MRTEHERTRQRELDVVRGLPIDFHPIFLMIQFLEPNDILR